MAMMLVFNYESKKRLKNTETLKHKILDVLNVKDLSILLLDSKTYTLQVTPGNR